MYIREMLITDIPQLAQLYKQFWNEESAVDKMYEQFQKFQERQSHVLLSAVENELLIGSVVGIICEEMYGECRPFMVVENMIVDKNQRNKGIGKALIKEIEKIARERNCTQIILVTEKNRIDACEFYESVGYNSNTHKGFKKKISNE